MRFNHPGQAGRGAIRAVGLERGPAVYAIAGALVVVLLLGLGELAFAAPAPARVITSHSPAAGGAVAAATVPLAWGPPALHYTVYAPSGPAGGAANHVAGLTGGTGTVMGGAGGAMPTGPNGFAGTMHCSSRMTRMMVIGVGW